MRQMILCIAIALLILSVYPQTTEIKDPVLATSVTSVVTKSGTVRALGGSLNYLQLNLSAPQKTDWQLPIYTNKLTKDSEGNTFFNIENNDPQNPFTYSISTEVLTKARMTDSLPQSYVVPESLKEDLLPSSGIQSDDKTIAELARRITENSSSDFERVAMLALWVHRNVEYDESMSGKEESATWVLSNKRGVCTEFTTLFIALARAVGIPSRYVSGYSFTTSKGWLGHAWAEVYIGDWIPVDPTWLEVGHLDATHIQVSSSKSGKTESRVFVYMSQGARLDWSGSGTLGSSISEVQVKDSQSMPESGDYELTAASQKISFGGETAVYAKLTSKDYRVIDLSLEPCSGESSLSVEDKERVVILEPGIEKVVVWKVNAPSALNSRYIYTCPLIINSEYLAGKRAVVEMREKAPEVSFTAQMSKTSLSLGEEQTVSFSSPTSLYEAKITVVAENKIYPFSASKATQEISFTPDSPGVKDAWVFSNFGGIRKLTYTVKATRSLSIGKVSIPERLVETGDMTVSIPITSNSTVPQTIRVTASFEGEERYARTALSGIQTFNFTFKNLKQGAGDLLVNVEGQGESVESKVKVEVMPKPSVSIQTTFSNGGNLTNVTFTASKTGDARSIRVYIDGKIAPLAGGSGTMGVPPGTHTMKVVWYDAYGQEFSIEMEIQVPKKGTIFEFSESGSPIPCPSLLVAPLLLLAFACSRRR